MCGVRWRGGRGLMLEARGCKWKFLRASSTRVLSMKTNTHRKFKNNINAYFDCKQTNVLQKLMKNNYSAKNKDENDLEMIREHKRYVCFCYQYNIVLSVFFYLHWIKKLKVNANMSVMEIMENENVPETCGFSCLLLPASLHYECLQTSTRCMRICPQWVIII